jgi:hypothetical protein
MPFFVNGKENSLLKILLNGSFTLSIKYSSAVLKKSDLLVFVLSVKSETNNDNLQKQV